MQARKYNICCNSLVLIVIIESIWYIKIWVLMLYKNGHKEKYQYKSTQLEDSNKEYNRM